MEELLQLLSVALTVPPSVRVLAVRHDDANMRRIASIQEDIKKEEKNLENMLSEDAQPTTDINQMMELLTDAKAQVLS